MDDHAFVGAFPSRAMAELAVTYLNANGVDAMVWADDAGGTYPHIALYRGIRLRVRAEDADAARDLLAEAEAAEAREPAPRHRRPLRPVGVWIVRLAAAAVVAGIAMSVLPPR